MKGLEAMKQTAPAKRTAGEMVLASGAIIQAMSRTIDAENRTTGFLMIRSAALKTMPIAAPMTAVLSRMLTDEPMASFKQNTPNKIPAVSTAETM